MNTTDKPLAGLRLIVLTNWLWASSVAVITSSCCRAMRRLGAEVEAWAIEDDGEVGGRGARRLVMLPCEVTGHAGHDHNHPRNQQFPQATLHFLRAGSASPSRVPRRFRSGLCGGFGRIQRRVQDGHRPACAPIRHLLWMKSA